MKITEITGEAFETSRYEMASGDEAIMEKIVKVFEAETPHSGYGNLQFYQDVDGKYGTTVENDGIVTASLDEMKSFLGRWNVPEQDIYERLNNLKTEIQELAKHPELISACDNRNNDITAAGSLDGALDYIGDAIDTYEKYNGIGEYAPTKEDLDIMALELREDQRNGR